jgi:hypothetical protein
MIKTSFCKEEKLKKPWEMKRKDRL